MCRWLNNSPWRWQNPLSYGIFIDTLLNMNMYERSHYAPALSAGPLDERGGGQRSLRRMIGAAVFPEKHFGRFSCIWSISEECKADSGVVSTGQSVSLFLWWQAQLMQAFFPPCNFCFNCSKCEKRKRRRKRRRKSTSCVPGLIHEKIYLILTTEGVWYPHSLWAGYSSKWN